MPYVSLPLLQAAVTGLKGKHPLAVVVVPAMVGAGVPVTDQPAKGAPYGATDEGAFLTEYFEVPGAPPDKPFRAVWDEDPNDYWRDQRYPGRSLQRMRTGRVAAGQGFLQEKSPGGKPDLWSLRLNAGQEIKESVDSGLPVRIIDLAVWLLREEEVKDLDELLARFKSVFNLDVAGLVGTLYDIDIPAHYRTLPLADESLTQDDYAEVLDALRAPPVLSTIDLLELVNLLEDEITGGGYVLPPGLVSSVVSGWLRGDIVILVGQPGTGKTAFARAIQAALETVVPDLIHCWIAVRPDFDEGDLIGYERLDGHAQLSEFATLVLHSESPLGPHLVVLEEMNLAPVDNYLASVLTASQDKKREVMLPGNQPATLPVDTFFLGTCNSYLEDPETRLQLSYPAKRRSTIISMPNVLLDRYRSDGPPAIVDLAVQMITQEVERIGSRDETGLDVTLDPLRAAQLKTIETAESLSAEVRTSLTEMSGYLLDTTATAQSFTLGLLRDVALAVGYAPREPAGEMAALGRAMSEKVVHQLRGNTEVATGFAAAGTALPNLPELEALLERMAAGPGDELVPLV